MSENIGLTMFMAFWSVLDAMFTFIDDAFRTIFNCIPAAAIPFLIAIFCYSVVAMMIYIIKKQPVGNRKVMRRSQIKILTSHFFYFLKNSIIKSGAKVGSTLNALARTLRSYLALLMALATDRETIHLPKIKK